MWTIYVNFGLRNYQESDLRSNKHYLSSNESKAWKNSVYGIWTCYLCSISAVLNHVSSIVIMIVLYSQVISSRGVILMSVIY